jgi:hypothetical protein
METFLVTATRSYAPGPDSSLSQELKPSRQHSRLEDEERFRADTLTPRLQGGIEGGFASRPEAPTLAVMSSTRRPSNGFARRIADRW